MKYVLIPLTLPAFLVGYLYVAFFSMLNATRRHRFDTRMWTWECVWAPWIIRPRTWGWITKNPFGRLFVWDEGGAWPEDSYNSVYNGELDGKKGRWLALPTGTKRHPNRKYAGNFWKYGTTLAYGIIYGPGAIPENDTTVADTRHERHEDVHVRQAQDELVTSFLVGLAVGIGFWAHGHGVAGVVWWMCLWLSGIAWRAPNFLTAWLRGGNPYRDSEHERSAYAQTDTHHVKDKSWIEKHSRKKHTF